ncbi:hypothetical protein EPN95_00470 [Patescibacteria group bacterium]|nr:MAG: hypothetical protein EPN95_00470 [Patescibacteria group bacterium]
MLNKKRSALPTIMSIAFTVAISAAVGWVILNRQFVLDQLNVWWFKPGSDVTNVITRAGMSDQGKFFYFASEPAIETAPQFNNDCQQQETGNAILGCYSGKRIYVYAVTNTQLDGIEEVTAAHETLHAIWDRMSDSDRASVGALLEAAFTKINDPTLNDRMAYYNRTEPGERLNELHSILGTEYANLGPALEAHYAKYFSDRSKVVALHTSYESVFDNLKKQSDALAAELDALKGTINANTKEYNAEAVSINNDAIALKASADSVDRTSASQVNAYNAKRQALLDRLNALDALRAEINSETDEYNAKVTEYNNIVTSTNNLNNSINSTLAPTPSV